MKIIPTTLILLLAANVSFMTCQAVDEGYNDKPGKFVRVSNNDDGSRTIFRRNPGDMQMLKHTYDPNGRLVSMAVYSTNYQGDTLGCYIYDGKKNLLFKVAYAYDKFGRLMKELMYDAKTEALTSLFEYKYDAMGKRMKPVCHVFVKGNDPDKRFHFDRPTALEKDPFADDEKAKPPGRKLR